MNRTGKLNRIGGGGGCFPVYLLRHTVTMYLIFLFRTIMKNDNEICPRETQFRLKI